MNNRPEQLPRTTGLDNCPEQLSWTTSLNNLHGHLPWTFSQNYGASRIDELLAIACRRERLAFGWAVAVPSTFTLGLTTALANGFAFTLPGALAWSRAWQEPRPVVQAWTSITILGSSDPGPPPPPGTPRDPKSQEIAKGHGNKDFP